MKNLKQSKFTNKLKSLSTRLQWLLFTDVKDLRSSSSYIDMICPENDNIKSDHISNLEKMVRQGLAKEFSKDIENTASYELLKDAVMYKLQKASLEE